MILKSDDVVIENYNYGEKISYQGGNLMSKPKLKMIVCVGENNLIGDKVPTGNGLLWHSMEELQYYKSKTIGNVVLFGENTAKYVPINLMKKNREVIVLTLESRLEDIMKQYEDSGKRYIYLWWIYNI